LISQSEGLGMIKKTYRLRIFLLLIFFALLFCIVEARLYVLQVSQHTQYESRANAQHDKTIFVAPRRGEILDRNYQILATSAQRDSVYVTPSLITDDREKLARDLAQILSLPEKKICEILQATSTRCAPLARKISRAKMNEIHAVARSYALPKYAIYFRKESKRLYPKNSLCASVIGFTTIDDYGDNKGIAGLEYFYNEQIGGEYKRLKTRQSAVRQYLDPFLEEDLAPSYGSTLVLTIDETIQYIAEKELRAAVSERDADGGVVIVMATKTGEILAMASCPSFDPNDFSKYPDKYRRNRCITDPIEPGSVLKIFTLATLLDENLATVSDILDCENGEARIEGRYVTDSGGHKMGLATVREAFIWSSNVGFSKLATRLEPQVFHEHLRLFGFGEKTGVDLPGEESGILYPPSKWTSLSRTSVAIGYEIATTALQIATAASAIANEGLLMRPYVVKEIRDYSGQTIKTVEPEVIRQVVKRSTAEKMMELMEAVVAEGTGKNAAIEGYVVAGKTGTTRKSHVKDQRAYIAGFVGVVPADDPELTIYTYIDKPQRAHFASDVAAPLFKRIAEDSLRCLGIPPNSKPVPMLLTSTVPDLHSEKAEPLQTAGTMPNVMGLTMMEVKKQLDGLPCPVRFLGSGVVTEQSPPPGTSMETSQRCLIVFGSPIAQTSDASVR
jgi:cell division protein FtsI/penicillin-binding protein 2